MIVHDVEQGTDEWHALRAGKPTASEFSKLVTSKGEPSKQMPDYAVQLAADYYAGMPLDAWNGNQWTDRGHEMEDRARAYYENTFPDRAVTQVGFITDDEERAGCSPDSLVNADGMLEIKCLKASTHVKMIVYIAKHERTPTDYIAQAQGQLLLAERVWCDLLLWHPDLPPVVLRQRPMEAIVVNLRLQISSCIDERNRIVEVIRKF